MDCSWISFCTLKPEAQAAWVQAIFSLVAIAAAVYVPWRQRADDIKTKRFEDHRSAVSLAARLYPLVKELEKNIQNAETTYMNRDKSGRLSVFSTPVVPQILGHYVDRIHLLGPGGEALIKAIFHVDQTALAAPAKSVDHLNEGEIGTTLAKARNHIDRAVAELTELLE